MSSKITRTISPYVVGLLVGLIALLSLVSGSSTPRAQAAPLSAAPSAVTSVHAATVKPATVKPVAKPLTAAQKRVLHVRHLEQLAKRHRWVIKSYRISGVKASAYKGKYYDARFETFRRCVIMRESMGNYWSVEHHSHAGGAYQFMPSWTRTLQHLTGERVPIWWMDRWAQDYAFWKVLNHGKGIGNWAGGRWAC